MLDEMNPTYYFKYQINTASQKKVIPLRAEMGAEGFGIYLMIREALANSPNLKYAFSDIKNIAFAYSIQEEKVVKVVRNFDLFIVEDEEFYDQELVEHFQFVEQKRSTLSANAKQKQNKKLAKADQMLNKSTAKADISYHSIVNNNIEEHSISNQNINSTDFERKQGEAPLKDKSDSTTTNGRRERVVFIAPSTKDIYETIMVKWPDMKNYAQAAADDFCSFYENKGWTVDAKGKIKMKSWQIALGRAVAQWDHSKWQQTSMRVVSNTQQKPINVLPDFAKI